MTNLQEIIDAAQALPPAQRAQIIHALWDSITPADWPLPAGDWIAESQRRSQVYDAGTMSASPWSDVRERARGEAGLND